MIGIGESMTVPEAAERLGISSASAYLEIANGRLPCRRLGPKGGKIRVGVDDLEAYWENCRQAPQTTARRVPQYIRLRDRRA